MHAAHRPHEQRMISTPLYTAHEVRLIDSSLSRMPGRDQARAAGKSKRSLPAYLGAAGAVGAGARGAPGGH